MKMTQIGFSLQAVNGMRRKQLGLDTVSSQVVRETKDCLGVMQSPVAEFEERKTTQLPRSPISHWGETKTT